MKQAELDRKVESALDVMATGYMNTTVETKVLKALLLKTGGWILRNGVMYDITSKHLGAGVHRIEPKRRF